jgi:hypothetical protein
MPSPRRSILGRQARPPQYHTTDRATTRCRAAALSQAGSPHVVSTSASHSQPSLSKVLDLSAKKMAGLRLCRPVSGSSSAQRAAAAAAVPRRSSQSAHVAAAVGRLGVAG